MESTVEAANDVNKSQTLPDNLLQKFIEKSVEMELSQDLATQSAETSRVKETILQKETKKLNELHNQIFQMDSELCDTIWKFTAKNDFATFIDHHLDTPTLTGDDKKDRIEKMENLLVQTNNLTMEIETMIEDLKQQVKTSDDNFNLKRIKEELAEIPEVPIKKSKYLDTPETPKPSCSSKFTIKTKSEVLKKIEKL